MPAGEGVSTGGWDGTVESYRESPYIPLGQSVWEISVRKDVNVKANSDYKKRVEGLDETISPEECTYVSVSLRRWAERTTWARERTEEGVWKKVEAYGVDDIEGWLETAPATHLWISEKLGLCPYGRRSATSWWDGWAAATTPPTPSSFVIAGREEQVTQINEFLTAEPQIITIGGTSVHEAYAFIAALADQAALEGFNNPISRSIFVDDLPAWRSLLASPTPLILIPQGEALREEVFQEPGRHHILIPVAPGLDSDVTLPPIDSSIAAERLRATGLEESRCLSVARLARRSLVAARRSIASKPELHQPVWATPGNVDQVSRGTLLAGAWRQDVAGDREFLSKLAGHPYENLQDRLSNESLTDDPFITRLGSVWFLVSPLDAWLLLSRHVQEADLLRFQDVAETALTEIDPALSLSSSERWMANLSGHVRIHSPLLRASISGSLAYLGTTASGISLSGGSTGGNWADALVKRVLSKANDDSNCAIWCSIHDVLPDLAEASPDTFLESVEEGLQGDTPLLSGMFTDSEDLGIFAPMSPHTGLLWALESLTWSPAHFGRTIDDLARLASIDPGGRGINRPLNSLVSAFHPGTAGKSVDEARRMRILDRLRNRHPAIAWNLMCKILPNPARAFLMPAHRPRFRDWPALRETFSHDTYTAFLNGMVERLMQDAGSNPERWRDIFSNYPSLQPAQRNAICNSFAERLNTQSINEDEGGLWESMRSMIARHRAHPDADWSLPEEELIKLDQMLESLTPPQPLDRYAWLFTNGLPDLGNQVRPDNFEEYNNLISSMRTESVATLVQTEGLTAILALADSVAAPWVVGIALANATVGRYEDELMPLLDEAGNPKTTCARGFFARRTAQEGWDWLEDLVTTSPLSAHQQGLILQLSKIHPQSWVIAQELGQEVSDAYWKEFQVFGLGSDFPHVSEASKNLSEVDRFAASLTLVSIYLRTDSGDRNIASTVVAAMSALVSGFRDPEVKLLSSYELERLLAYLETCIPEVDAATVISLEWAFLPAMASSVGESPEATLLQRSLSEDPDAFAQMVEFSHRPKGQTDDTPRTEMQVRVAENAYRLLNEWSVVPGLQSDGTVSIEVLSDWFRAARTRLTESNRSEVGDGYIGRILSHLPVGQDGVWPCEEARDFLEDNLQGAIAKGVRAGILAQRGIVRRSVEEGGEQERKFAQRYSDASDRLADEWPRLASSLRSLAEWYESLARREDEEAEFDRRGFLE
ncbi:hypothetical protein [Streptomyces phaeochromogenes]